VSGDRRCEKEHGDTLGVTKGVVIFVVLLVALGIAMTLLFEHQDFWTPDQLLIAP
jgi:hypothetical protein